MSRDIKSSIAHTYVEPRGAIRSFVSKAAGRELLGTVGGVVADMGTKPPEKSPVKAGDIAYMAVFADEVVVFKGKRGAFKPKPTEEVIATVPRSAVASARLDRKSMKGVLTLTFQDGEPWEFDMPRAYLKSADAVAKALG